MPVSSPPAGYRNIDYGQQLYSALRNYYSVNSSGVLNVLFTFCACCIAPLQTPFNNYIVARLNAWIVAQCAWEVGQLTNVLNMIYDPMLKRIYIIQSASLNVEAPVWGVSTPVQAPIWGVATPVEAPVWGASAGYTELTFIVPMALAGSLDAIEATIAQIALAGISYQVVLV